jgi:predicted Zn-dependent protease
MPFLTPLNPKNLEQALQALERHLEEWSSTPLGRRAFLAAVPTLLLACAAPQKTRYREGDNSNQETSLTVADEVRMTQEVLPELRKEYPLMNHPGMQAYVSALGQKLVTSNGLAGNPYQYSFSMVDTPQVNAFALPAGTVFVTAPLLAMADSEAELMGVLGHEVGHIQARHTAERMDKAKKEQKKSLLYGIGGGLLGGAAGFGAGKLLCKKDDKKCLQQAALLGAGAGVAGGLLIQKFAFMANSREDEMEADRIGFRTSVATGYHKDHVGLFYAKLLQMEEKSKQTRTPILSSIQDAMSTHPPSRERVAQMNQMAQVESVRVGAKISSPEFEEMRKIAKSWKPRTA